MNLVPYKLRVIHMPQIPCKGFQVDVRNESEAYLICQALANQHLFLFENQIIPDYSNIILVEMFKHGEWVDYYNDLDYCEWDEFIELFPEYINL